jgi:hypothetical protein
MAEPNPWVAPGTPGPTPAAAPAAGSASGPPTGFPTDSLGHTRDARHPRDSGNGTGPHPWSQPDRGSPRGTDTSGEPAPQTVTIPLRPLDIAELLDGAIANIRRNPRVVLGSSLLVTSVIELSVAASEYAVLGGTRLSVAAFLGTRTTSAYFLFVAGNTLLTGMAILVLAGLFAPVVARTAIGRRTSPARVWADARPRAARSAAAALLSGLLPFGGLALALLPGGGLLVLDAAPLALSVPLTVLGGCAGGAAAAWLYVRYAFAAPALALEGGAVLGALRRSAQLVRRRWWRTLGALLLAVLLTTVIGSGMQLPFSLAATILAEASEFGASDGLGVTTAAVVETVGRIISGTLTNPFNAGLITLLYADHRFRREGFDLELRTRVRDRSAAANDLDDPSADALTWLWRPSELTGSTRQAVPWQDEPTQVDASTQEPR